MKNYQYWQQEGAYWKEEYERRRRNRFYFIVQEAAIAYFFSLNSPAKLLEYGCGVGRHLKYLREISGLDIYGCDQSSTMLEATREWGGDEWFEQHIELITPTGAMPYKDGAFDIAFTSEVLIHTRPEDVSGRLRELVRVTTKGVFHTEPDTTVELCHDAHHGCWNHDYVELYRELGIECTMLPKFFENQAFFLVDMEGCLKTGLLKNKVVADKFSLLDSFFEGFIAKFSLLKEELDNKEKRISSLEGGLDNKEERINSLQADLNNKEERINSLQADFDNKVKALEKRYQALAEKGSEHDRWLTQIHERTEAMRIDRQLKRILQRVLLLHRKKG